MIKNLLIPFLIRNNTSFEDFYWINSVDNYNESIKYLLLIISLILIQIIILYEILILLYEFFCLGYDNKDKEIKYIIIKYKLNYITQNYLLNNFYFYLFILYFLEIIFFILIYFFYINLSNKLITFYLILIVLFLSIFGRLLGLYLDNFTDWELAKKMRFEKLEEAQEILKKQEDKLRKYHIINYGKIFEDIIKKEINKKKQARLNEIDRSLFETKFEDLDTETSKLIYDRFLLPGRLQNFIIIYCIYILLYILTIEDFSIFKIIFLLLYSNQDLYLE